MIYKRRYLQYNELVFDDVIDDDYSTSFKTFESDYGFGNGAYSPQKRKGLWTEPTRVSFSITLKMKRIPCEHRPFYLQFAKSQLTTQGKLWAVQDNTIIWAYAILENLVEVHSSRNNQMTLDLDFTLPEGVWHKADKLRTFVVPFDPCSFIDCYGFKEIDPCECCNCAQPIGEDCDCCDCIEKDMALCYFKEFQDLYGCDNPGYKFVIDCAKGQEFFGDYDGVHFGQKLCADCGEQITGYVYSDTEIPTGGIRITLHGEMKDPYIEINGNGNIIKGEYNGTLLVNPDGAVYFQVDENCPACDPLDVSVWEIPMGMKYGWTVHAGKNSVIIDTGGCCLTCAYIEIDALAI